MRYAPICHCTSALCDTRTTSAPSGWWTTRNSWSVVICPVAGHGSMILPHHLLHPTAHSKHYTNNSILYRDRIPTARYTHYLYHPQPSTYYSYDTTDELTYLLAYYLLHQSLVPTRIIITYHLSQNSHNYRECYNLLFPVAMSRFNVQCPPLTPSQPSPCKLKFYILPNLKCWESVDKWCSYNT